MFELWLSKSFEESVKILPEFFSCKLLFHLETPLFTAYHSTTRTIHVLKWACKKDIQCRFENFLSLKFWRLSKAHTQQNVETLHPGMKSSFTTKNRNVFQTEMNGYHHLPFMLVTTDMKQVFVKIFFVCCTSQISV